MNLWESPSWIEHTQVLLDSYFRWLRKDLIDRQADAKTQAQKLFEADFIVVSHGRQSDPILSYGNQAALDLWQMSIEQFLNTPSRYTAEPMHRDERAELLDRTTRFGFVDDYSGIRISSTGKRFRIEQATVWNLHKKGELVGQAATFSKWFPLDESA